MSQYTKASLIVLGVLILDQAFKLWIRTTMYLGEEVTIFDWFRLHFTENRGIAFGLQFGGDIGKIFLTLFRIAAAVGIGYFLHVLIRKRVKSGMIISVCLILAGAIGNIIDSVFYGLIFDYGGLLFGRVVDMLYFPLYEGYLPGWLPIWGGQHLIFFRPVFNIADSAITTGVIAIILFYRNIFDEL